MGRRETFVDVPGGRLRVVDEGAGPAVHLIHAGIARLEAWDAMAPILVAAGYRVVRHDMRSWGGSVVTDPTTPFAHHVDIIAVLDALGIGRAALIGNSMGGRFAFDAAIAYPDRVVAVVGVGAGLGGYEGPATDLEMDLFEEMDRLESADPVDAGAVADIDVRVWVDGPGQPEGRAPAWIRDAIRSWDTPLYGPGRVVGTEDRLSPPAADRLAELTCPVLAVAGGLDPSESVAMAEFLAANAPDARSVIWDDVAHMIGMEVPDRLSGEILAFLAPLPRWG